MVSQVTADPLKIPFPCLLCDEVFSLKMGLTKHVNSKHTDVKRNCKGKGRLCKISHRRIGKGNVLHVCDQCDFQHPDKGPFKIHFKSKHASSYPCNKCDYKSKTKDQLRQHYKIIHDGVRYSCSKCDYQSTNNRSLKNHILVLYQPPFARYDLGIQQQYQQLI